MIFASNGSSFLKVIDEQNTLCILKYGGQNLVCWCLRLWSLWTAFTRCCPLRWLPIWLWSEVMNPCYIHCHIFTQKLLFNALNPRCVVFDRLWVNAAPTLNTAFFHWQMFMQNGEYTAFWISSIPLLSHTILIYNRPKQIWGVFLVFTGTAAKFEKKCLYNHI